VWAEVSCWRGGIAALRAGGSSGGGEGERLAQVRGCVTVDKPAVAGLPRGEGSSVGFCLVIRSYLERSLQHSQRSSTGKQLVVDAVASGGSDRIPTHGAA